MPGVRMKVRGVLGNVYDNFTRNSDPIQGSVTPVGSKTWIKQSTGDVVVKTAAGAIVAASGAASDMYLINAGSALYKVSFTVSAIRTNSGIPSFVFRATDEADHIAVALRSNTVTPQYTLLRRRAGVNYNVLETGVVPKSGDRVTIVALTETISLYVNGVLLGSSLIDGWLDKPLLGWRMFGTDTVTSFDDLSIFTA